MEDYIPAGQINSSIQKDAIHGKVNVLYACFTYIQAPSAERLSKSCVGLAVLRGMYFLKLNS